jgi:hypothetical protein
MNIPGYAAEASLYKSTSLYWGHGGISSAADAPLQVVMQQDCQSQCYSQYQQCLNTCGCPSGYTNCGGICTVLDFDISNCGACGHICKGKVLRRPGDRRGLYCFYGRCACDGECCVTDEAGNCTYCAVPPYQCP